MGWLAGMPGAALPAVDGCGCVDAGAGSDFLPSSSRMSAPSPRPSAFLAIRYHLFCKMRVAFGPFAIRVVENDGFAETRGFCQANIARNDALENLLPEESVQIVGHLARELRSFVVHGQKNAFDLEVRIQGPPDAHQRIL